MNFALEAIVTTPVVGQVTVELLLIAAAMLGAVIFVVLYPVLSDFRKWTREGWHIWLFTMALVSLGGSSITRRIWPEAVHHSAYIAATLSTYGLIAVLMWHRDYLLVTARRHDAMVRGRSSPRAGEYPDSDHERRIVALEDHDDDPTDR